ncbi:MAG TPA: pitrilysin family protein [Terriglobia bacterium]|nr:pitrilysin family protein [Terriglobia bacterium]
MNRRLKFILAVLIAVSAVDPTSKAGAQATWKQIAIPPLHAFHPQEPRRIELSNGMVIFLQEDHELPLIRGTARIRGGSRQEPANKVGLVSIYGDVWRTGGTASKTGDELDDYLEARAARIEADGSIDSTTISWDCLKDNFGEVFPIFVDLLEHPAFRADKLPLAKNQLNTGIARRNDEPAGIAAREAAKLGYGADSPYARQAEYSTVAAVTRDDLVAWHQTYVHPNNLILGVVGDFDSKAMEARLREAFGSWAKGPAAKPAEVSFAGPKPGFYFVEKSDVDQSNIRMVELGTTRDNPDYYAITVLNEIFGGGFTSRLMRDVRTAKGLAYSVGGGIGTAFDHPGLFQVVCGTKSSTTAAAIQALEQEIDDLTAQPPTDEELKEAKDHILNSFVFEFDSKEKVLAERMAYEFYGYPADFLERYRTGIDKVTRADVERVAHKYVYKDQLAVLVVGKAADFDRPLSSFGPVTTLDISIPSASAAPSSARGSAEKGAPANPHAAEEGKALLSKVIEGLGGDAKVRSVHAIRRKGRLVMKSPRGEMSLEVEELDAFPDQLWQKMTSPMGEMSVAVSPTAAFVTTPRGARDLPASQKEDVLQSVKREPLFVVQHAGDSKFTFSAAGSEKIGGVEAAILDVDADGSQVRWWVDPATGHILRSRAQTMGMSGPTEEITDYAGWKVVDGISVAFQEKVKRGAEEGGSSELQEFEVNPKIDPKLFEKPPANTSDKPAQ